MFLKEIEPQPLLDELISLTDLMFRWQYEPTFKITMAVQLKQNKNPLKLYHINTSTDSISGRKILNFTEITYSLGSWRYYIDHFNELIFFRKDIDELEKKNKRLTSVPDKLDSSAADISDSLEPDKLENKKHFQLCTIDNVSRLAPQLLYVILSCAKKEKAWRATFRKHLYSDGSDYDDVDHNFTTRPKLDWRVYHNRLWPKFQLPNPDAVKDRPFNDNAYGALKNFVQDKRNKGFKCDVRTNDLLLALLHKYVRCLSDEQLGLLIPANPGLDVGGDAPRKRGKWLRIRAQSLKVSDILYDC